MVSMVFKAIRARVPCQTSVLSLISSYWLPIETVARVVWERNRSGVLRQEAVAHAVHSQKMAGHVGLRLQLLAQLYDVRIHRAGVGEEFVAPDRIENHVAREGAIGVL